MSRRKSTCDGCGCNCKNCSDSVGSLHLHVEIENLKQRLLERENHIVTMETNFLREAEKFPNGEMAALTDELLTWQDKYSRLYESHKRVQKVNQNLEDKLLKIVDKCETEKSILTAEVSALTRRLVDEKFSVSKLQEENERYRNDVNLAIQLLQCKPSNFVPQKYDSLPSDLQQKVRNYVTSKRRISIGDGQQQKQPEMKTIKVPIPTFPPTAMVYSVNKTTGNDKEGGQSSNGYGSEDRLGARQGPVDIVSAAIMAKVLEERERERSQMKHCDTCTCAQTPDNNHASRRRHDKETQTNPVNINQCPSICNNNPLKPNNLLLDGQFVNSDTAIVNMTNENHVLKDVSCVGNSHSNHNILHSISVSNSTTNSLIGTSPSVSSPMNIKRNRWNLVATTNHNNSSSMMTIDKNVKDLMQTDFFSEFNMSPIVGPTGGPVMEESASLAAPCSRKKLVNCGNSRSSVDVPNDVNENAMRNLRLSRLALENSKNTTGNSVDKELNDCSENLIIFDRPTNQTMSNSLVGHANGISSCGGNSSTNSSVSSNSSNSSSRSIGVRHCSVRLQAGTSNILLDNVVDGPYAPVLYKSRPQAALDPLLVHAPPSRSLSASSSTSSFNNEEQPSRIGADCLVANNCINSSSFVSASSSTSSSTSSTPSSSLSSIPLRKNNLMLAQLRTETEI